MGDFIGQVVLLTIHAERKRNSYFRFETGKDKIQYQIGTTRHRNTRSSQLVPIIILENHICDMCYPLEKTLIIIINFKCALHTLLFLIPMRLSEINPHIHVSGVKLVTSPK